MTTPDLARVPGPLTIGQAIREIRTRLYPLRHRERLSQGDFYWRCHDEESGELAREENGLSPKGRKKRQRRFDEVSDSKYAERKIRGIETDTKRQADLSLHELSIIARALRLNPAFFKRDGFDSLAALEQAYNEDVWFQTVEAGKTEAKVPSIIRGFQRLSPNERLPLEREAQLLERQGDLVGDQANENAILLLEGPTGVGKTFLINKWFYDYGAPHFKAGALCIDVAGRSIDQILPAIEPHFAGAENGHRRLIVIDGARLDHFREGPRRPSSAAARPSLGELIRAVKPLVAGEPPTTIIIGLERNAGAIDETALLREVPESTTFATLRVDPLSHAEGARFLASLGVTHFQRHELEEISALLMGIPLALSAAAYEIGRLRDEEREHYLDSLRSGQNRAGEPVISPGFENLFRDCVKRLAPLDGTTGEEGRHPLALLRLLSLMPGPIPCTHLEAILAGRRVRRLERLQVDDILHMGLPFISMTDDTIDEHAFVRSILRSELEAFFKESAFDNHSSRNEIEWIHWRMCTLLWTRVQHLGSATRASDFDGAALVAVEAFVYHMAAQIRLLPRHGQDPQASARRKARPQSGITDKSIEQFFSRSGRLSDANLWQFAYQKAVKPVLFDRRYRMTRFLGQFDAKARILRYLVAAAEEGGAPVHPSDLAILNKEIAICHMHSGRLALARRSIAQAASALLRGHPEVVPERFKESRPQSVLHQWPLYCEIVSASAAIDMRTGAIATEVRDTLQEIVETAEWLTTHRPDEEAKGEYAPPMSRGALRILTRWAELTLLRGDVEKSLAQMRAASLLQERIRQRTLDGEAARRYVLALVRGRHEHKGRLELARTIVEANLARYRELAVSQKRLSIDIYPFLILEAGLDRVEGNIERAEARLSDFLKSETFQRRECTYVTMAEAEFESVRIAVAKNGSDEGLADKAIGLAKRLHASHHELMSHEATLLAAEAASGEKRKELLRGVSHQLENRGYRLRLEDVVELEAGRSAIATFGL